MIDQPLSPTKLDSCLAWPQDVSDAVDTVSRILDSGKPILITGPAACGKSTLTKQYTYHVAKAFLGRTSRRVPVLVTVIELAATIKERGLKESDDVLVEHLRHKKFASDQPLVDFLVGARRQGELLLVLDGIDEAGEARAVLEPYIAGRLAGEVLLCLTGRENGIEAMERFGDFAHFHIQALNKEQQEQIVTSRMQDTEVRNGEVTLDERVRDGVARAVSSGRLPWCHGVR